MYVSSLEMILAARRGGYAIPAFNAENLEMVQAILEAAEAESSPVIIQTTPTTVDYLTLEEASAMVRAIADKSRIPTALHLDHCQKLPDVMKAVKAGYSSVMFDGSRLPFDENARITARIKEAIAPMGITLESELGTVGGKEDDLDAAGPVYTDPDEAAAFIRRTGTDLLAIGIGTAHGFYKGTPRLDIDRIARIRAVIDTPLVMHGGSGLPDAMIRSAIEAGMSKVNFATELRAAFTEGARSGLADAAVIDPKKYLSRARSHVFELCRKKIRLCGSNGRA